MSHNRSYILASGIIPLRKKNDHWEVFIVKKINGDYWGFPKGHPEEGEDKLTTAKRELFEETLLQVKELLSDQTIEESYSFVQHGTTIHKKVYYYVAIVEGEPEIDKKELIKGKWLPLAQAIEQLTFDETRALLEKVIEDYSLL